MYDLRSVPGRNRYAGPGDRARLAVTVGLAHPVHGGPVLRPAGPAIPRRPGQLPHEGRCRAVPPPLRDDVRIAIRHHTRVTRVTRDGAGFTVHTDGETYYAAQVVVATGPFQLPVIPAVADAIGPDIVQLHSSDYRNPEQLPTGPVLVVGAANSGVQIAAELHRTRPVTLASGSATRSLPQRILGRDLFWWLTTRGLFTAPAQSRLGRRFRNSGELVIGTSTRQLAKAGVTVHPRVTATDATRVTFADGTSTTPAVIVWATGYRSDYSFIDIPGATDTTGAPVHHAASASSPACTTSASRGSTPGDRRCSASSAPTPHTSPHTLRPHPCRLPDRPLRRRSR